MTIDAAPANSRHEITIAYCVDAVVAHPFKAKRRRYRLAIERKSGPGERCRPERHALSSLTVILQALTIT